MKQGTWQIYRRLTMTTTPVRTDYGVGWYYFTPAQLEALYPDKFAVYREQAQSIITFGKTDACWRNTPEEAQAFLDQILSSNSDSNLRALTPLGADGLFIVERKTLPGSYPVLSKYGFSGKNQSAD